MGGGLPVKDVNRKLLHTLGTVVYLKAEVSTLENRLSGDNKKTIVKRRGSSRENNFAYGKKAGNI